MMHTAPISDSAIAASGVRGRLVTLFLAALAIRWAYALATLAFAGLDGLKFGDSYRYLALAAQFADAIRAGQVAGWAWLGPELPQMPLFTWSITAHAALAGTWAPLTFVLAQGLLDAGTCLLVFGIARALDARIALWAGYAAAVAPTLVILAGIVYTDTAFVFFATLSLYGAVRWLRAPSWRWALMTAAGLGAATLVRIWIVPWVVPLLLLLVVAGWFRHRLRGGQILQLGSIAMVLALCLSPIALRNVTLYGAWALTPQSGVHLAMWVVPLVREASDGTPHAKTIAAMEARLKEKFGPTGSGNPFVESAHYSEIAVEELRKIGTPAIAKAWVYGMAINLASPAVTMVPAVAKLPRTGFYDTAGRDVVEKVTNFLFRSENALYGWLLVTGIAGVAVIRLVQLAGGLTLLFRKGAISPVLLLLAWSGYVLAVNGPVASPKYRLPLEPVLALLTGAALERVFRRRARPAR